MSISTGLHSIRELTGWRALLLAYLAGALMVAGFAPFYAWPVIFISLPLCYLLLHAAPSMRNAAWRGFAFGYGYFMAGTWWIANSMLVDAAKFAWMMPFSILGLSAVLAIYFGLFGALVYWTRHHSPSINLLRFVLLWGVVEYLRSAGAYGFPWNLAGYITLASDAVAQFGAVVGTFGLGLLVVGAGIAPLLLLQRGRSAYAGVLLPVAIIGGLYGYGQLRLAAPVEATATVVRIVQPSIPQAIKHTFEGKMAAMRLLVELSAEEGQDPDVIVWPETAYPKTIRTGQTNLYWPYSPLLITGAVAFDDTQTPVRIYNSIAAIDASSEVMARYDKHQLVPFGEFVPLRSVLPISKITPGDTDFTRGEGAQTVMVPHLPPFSPLVCYEVIFPWMATDPNHRPEWIVNVTNDAWYGNSPGPYQHYDTARMRAIEQGLPLVRVANNGISAMLDPYGRAVAKLALDERGIRDVLLPQPLPPTPYARYGEWLALLLLAAGWALTRMKRSAHTG